MPCLHGDGNCNGDGKYSRIRNNGITGWELVETQRKFDMTALSQEETDNGVLLLNLAQLEVFADTLLHVAWAFDFSSGIGRI